MTDVLLLGAQGMLARGFAELLQQRGIAYTRLGRPQFDLSRAADVAALPLKPETRVINCVAYTDVDKAEGDEAAASAVNAIGVGHLAQRCAQTGSTLLHFSTDYVFSGTACEPYAIHALQAPLGAYGRTKAEGERRIWAVGPNALIVRTSWLYAPWGRNFVGTIAKLAQTRPQLRVVDDQRGRPTSVQHLTKASWDLLEANHRGIVHVTDGGECTWFEFAKAIAAAVNPSCEVLPCTTAEFPRPAPRPAYSVLDLDRAESVLGAMPPWQEQLLPVLQEMESGQSGA